MIWLIAKKDFLLNLLSVRFMIGFILCLVIIPFTMIVSVDDYQNQVRIYHIDKEKAEAELKELKVYSALRPTVVKEPEVMSIFSKGINPNIGNNNKVSLQEYPLFPAAHTSSRDNPLLNAFFSIDFSKVIAIVISLLALVFAYDSITRERENGTMKLVFTGQVSRISFLFGKLTGLLLTLLPILLFCYLLACLIIAINTGISLTSSDWTGILLLFLTSLIYLLVFIVLGMFISTLTSRSSSAIILSLLCWIGFLFLIPNMATYLSKSISRTPLYDNVQAVFNERMDEYNEEYWGNQFQKFQKELNIKNYGWWNANGGDDGYFEISGGSWEVAEHVRRLTEWGEQERIKIADEMWLIQKDYLNQLVRQQQVQQYLSWLSPSELFGQATDLLCRTDVNAFMKYMDSQRDYRETIIRFIYDNHLTSSFLYITPQPEEDFPTEQELEDFYAGKGGRGYSENWSPGQYEKINTDNVPRYVYTMSSAGNTFQAALGRLSALLAITILLLLGMIATFMKYDVR